MESKKQKLAAGKITSAKIRRMIEKNFTLMKRTKSSLVIVLGPLLLILLIGLAFSSTDNYNINVGVYSNNYGNLTNIFVERLDEKYELQKEPAEEMCIDDVKQGVTSVCVVFPADLEVKDGYDKDIKFHVDYSEINLIYNILDLMSETVKKESRNISLELTNDILSRLKSTEDEINSKVPVIVSLAVNNDRIYTAYNEMQENLAKLDLSINTEVFNSGKISTEAKHMRNLAYQVMQDANDLIDNIETDVNGLSGNKTRIRYYLIQGKSDMIGYMDELRASDAVMNYTVSELNQQIGDASQKIITANVVRNTAKDKLVEAKQVLDDNLAALGEIQQSFNDIKKTVSAMSVKNATKIVEPISTNVMPITNRKTHFNYIFPLLVVLVVMVTGILFSSSLIMNEKRSRSFFRNFISPTGDILFLLAAYSTALIVVMLQVIIFLVVSSLLFRTSFVHSLFSVLISLFLISTFFILTGMLVGLSVKKEEISILTSVALCSIFLFFSSTILPLETMPLFMKSIAQLNPFVVSNELLKATIFFDFSMGVLLSKMYPLIFYIIILICACVFIQNRLRMNTLAGSIEDAKKTMGSLIAKKIDDLENMFDSVEHDIRRKIEEKAEKAIPRLPKNSISSRIASKVAESFEERMVGSEKDPVMNISAREEDPVESLLMREIPGTLRARSGTSDPSSDSFSGGVSPSDPDSKKEMPSGSSSFKSLEEGIDSLKGRLKGG